MSRYNTHILPAGSSASLERAKIELRQGACVALPTETVYGLACCANDATAVARVYSIKGRPQFNPLIVHVDNSERANKLVDLTSVGKTLAQVFWPGPLTIVAKQKSDAGICPLVTAGLDSLGVRWPQANAMTTLIRQLDTPLAAPSANRSGKISPTCAGHVKSEIDGKVKIILDNGPCAVGIESTIVEICDGRVSILRHGTITASMIEKVINQPITKTQEFSEKPRSPGQLLRHYAPNAAIRLNVTQPDDNEGFLAFGHYENKRSGKIFNLSERGDLAEAASRLYLGLRSLDDRCGQIAVAPLPNHGLGIALNDKLKRACKT